MRPAKVVVLAFLLCVAVTIGAYGENAKGCVFNDKNGNGVRDAGEKGLAKVLVSNGVDIVETDRQGQYAIPVTDDTVLFVVKPAGWMCPVGPGNNIPRFYYIHKPKGSPAMKYTGVAPTGPLPASVDFPLRRQHESNRFKMVCMGDTQPRDVEEVQFIAHDLLEDLTDTGAAFGLTLGDVVFNDLTVFEPLVQAMSATGLPWRYVPGNHDHNHDAPTTEQTAETFTRVFGPQYYSFNYGQVHFVVLNDIRHDAKQDKYHGGLGEKQMAFLKNDLSHVKPSQLVVLTMHIPITGLDESKAIYALLKDFPNTFSLSAHTHSQCHVFIDRSQGWQQDTPHHHLNHGTSCGCWWGGSFDEVGIPTAQMADGVPNGYSFITFDGAKYSVEYRVARRPADYQMNVWLPEVVSAPKAADTAAIVNVFAGSSKSTVEMRLDGAKAWTPMEAFVGSDPFFTDAFARQDAFLKKLAKDKGVKEITKEFTSAVREEFHDNFRVLPKPDTDVTHLWRANLPAGLPVGGHTLEVRTTDMFGHIYTAKRMFSVGAGK